MFRSCRREVQRALSEEGGSNLVAFAMVALVFFMITLGAVEFGRAIFYYNIISNATRDGVRYAVVRGSSSGPACGTWSSAKCMASTTDVQEYVRSRVPGLVAANVTVTPTWTPNNAPGSVVQVQTTYVFNPTTARMLRSVTLHSTAKMVISR